jgi:hypothetical protein
MTQLAQKSEILDNVICLRMAELGQGVGATLPASRLEAELLRATLKHFQSATEALSTATTLSRGRGEDGCGVYLSGFKFHGQRG